MTETAISTNDLTSSFQDINFLKITHLRHLRRKSRKEVQNMEDFLKVSVI